MLEYFFHVLHCTSQNTRNGIIYLKSGFVKTEDENETSRTLAVTAGSFRIEETLADCLIKKMTA